ncbi:MAG TPA: cohesin domain-containing protein [Saprospiraceae bacterium]|nr:cohesin domain-containing protein [Saprospiraceae bacterium]HMQ81321.1 cohesin domain-containing protein [Saprospiraceae bacterium]
MKYWIFLLGMGLMAFACKNDQSAAQKEAAAELVAANAEKGKGPAAGLPTKPAPGAPEGVGYREPYQPQQSGNQVIVFADAYEAKTGAEICVEVKAQQFQNLLSMQHSVHWDAKILEFIKLSKFGLPAMGNQNFGTHRTKEGILTFAWIDNALKGVSIGDGAALYAICFKVIGSKGAESSIQFKGEPTAFESVDLEEKLVEIVPKAGKVTVQ